MLATPNSTATIRNSTALSTARYKYNRIERCMRTAKAKLPETEADIETMSSVRV